MESILKFGKRKLWQATLALVLIVVTLTVIYFVSDKNQYHNTDCAQTAYEIFLDDIGVPFNDAKDRDAAKQNKQDYFDNIATCSDLSAQWRMSVVTERAFYIGLVGIFLIFVTWLATREAVIEARDTARKELRAYISVQTLMAKIVGKDIQIFLVIENAGQTPSSNTRVSWSYSLVGATDAAVRQEGEFNGSYGSIASGSERHSTFPLIFEDIDAAQEFVGAIIDGELRVEVTGFVEYSDIYNLERATFFSGNLNTFDGIQSVFQMTKTGNEMT